MDKAGKSTELRLVRHRASGSFYFGISEIECLDGNIVHISPASFISGISPKALVEKIASMMEACNKDMIDASTMQDLLNTRHKQEDCPCCGYPNCGHDVGHEPKKTE